VRLARARLARGRGRRRLARADGWESCWVRRRVDELGGSEALEGREEERRGSSSSSSPRTNPLKIYARNLGTDVSLSSRVESPRDSPSLPRHQCVRQLVLECLCRQCTPCHLQTPTKRARGERGKRGAGRSLSHGQNSRATPFERRALPVRADVERTELLSVAASGCERSAGKQRVRL